MLSYLASSICKEVNTKMLNKMLTHKQYLDVVRHPSTTAG